MKKILVMTVIFITVQFNLASAEIICVKQDGNCDAYKVKVPNITAPGIYPINGYQYGCSGMQATVTGTINATGKNGRGSWLIGATAPYLASSTPGIISFLMTYNPDTGVGTLKGLDATASTVDKSSGTYRKVSCPSNAVSPDAESEETDYPVYE